MRLPQSNTHPLSTRVFSIITFTLFVTMLSLCERAAAQQLTCTPSGLRFGNVLIGQNETEVMVLKNGGQTNVTVSAMKLRGTEFSVSNLSLPLSLPAGQSVPLKDRKSVV